ncbi:MFS transporter [Bradyrhizobium macuxiense]|uniref:MFS transporter n=1 Tax=Bradyrhizobium macuxiense TaxID=1755647 RepID=A0A109K070_9BRAD|nr:MFS transporter [Bradyrhizobium macuxiense]KWV58377.1 MFS transporter [Bradyrhizobium macuxiense]
MTVETAAAEQGEANRWTTVAVVVGCGVAAALQVGKVPIAATMLRTDLGIDLAAIGTIAGIFAVLGLVGSIPAGLVIAATGERRMLLLGLGAIALGSASGALAPSLWVLLGSRLLEGLGVLLVAVAAPALLGRLVEPRARAMTMALWSCYMPFGIATAMLAGPYFPSWRAMWWTSAAIVILLLALVYVMVPDAAPKSGQARTGLFAQAVALVRRSTPALLTACFALYSLMFFAVFSFLPILLTQHLDLSGRGVGVLSAVAALANVIGNLAAGRLLARGVGRDALIGAAALVMGVSALGIFMPVLGGWGAFWLCLVFAVSGGLIPATLLSSAPAAASSPATVPVMMGLLMMGSNLGQVVGPIAVGMTVSAWGWSAAGIMVLAAAIFAGVAAWRLAAARQTTG